MRWGPWETSDHEAEPTMVQLIVPSEEEPPAAHLSSSGEHVVRRFSPLGELTWEDSLHRASSQEKTAIWSYKQVPIKSYVAIRTVETIV